MADYLPLATDHWLLTTHHWLLTTGYSPLEQETRAAQSMRRWCALLKTTRDGGAPDADVALQAAVQAEDADAQLSLIHI